MNQEKNRKGNKMSKTKPVSIYVGFMVWQVGSRDIFEQIEWTKANGFEALGVHLNPWLAAQNRGIDIDKLTKAEHKKLHGILNGFKEIDIHAPFKGVDDIYYGSPNPQIREVSVRYISKVIEQAGDLGAKTVTIHGDISSVKMSSKEQNRYLTESFLRLDEVAGKNGIMLGIELSDVKEFNVPDRIGLKNAGLTLDVGHVTIFGYPPYKSLGDVIKKFGRKMIHLHIHDVDKNNVDHIPLGKGKIDFEDIVGSLKKINYSGSLCLELSTGNPKTTEKDILHSKDILEKLIKK